MSANPIIDVFEEAVLYNVEPRISVGQLRATREDNVFTAIMMNLAADVALAKAADAPKNKAAA